MSQLNLFFFGAPHIQYANLPIQIHRRKGMALLAYMTLTGRTQSREAMATLLWPEFDQTRALSNLRREISRLKQDLEFSLFQVSHKQISLNPEAKLWLDVERFKALLETVDNHDHFPEQYCDSCLVSLREAVDLYTEDFLAGFTLPDAPGFDEWQFFERESLRQQLADSLQKLIEWHSRQNAYGDAVNYARRWLAIDPLHEPAHRHLMTLYAQDDQQSAALRQYDICVRLLDEELGIEPERATTELFEAIRTRKFPLAQTPGTLLGDEALAQGRFLEAQSWFQERLQQAKLAGDIDGMAAAWGGLGRTSIELAHLEMAQNHFFEALRQVQVTQNTELALQQLADLTAFYAASGAPMRALELGTFAIQYPLCGEAIKEQCNNLLAGIKDISAENLAAVEERIQQWELWTLIAQLVEALDPGVIMARQTAVPLLPIPATPFIGRKKELADIHQLLLGESESRLLTLIGPGGVGKTRLAREVAVKYRYNFRDGVFFVPLARLSAADQLTTAIAESLDYQFYGSIEPIRQLVNFFGNNEMLLVLDNFEHVVEGAPIVAEILRAAPNVQILVTSREALNLRTEVLYHLQGLAVPPEEIEFDSENGQYDAVELLKQEARRIKPELVFEAEALQHARRIVCMVQGMPLAVLMAAGWLSILSLSEIAAEIADNLGLLETTARDVPERQRSMQATFDYSWQKLQPSEQQIFMKLSVFRGGFNRHAAQAVTGADLRSLRVLLNKSFLTVDSNGRFTIHELLRQYGWEYLTEQGQQEQVQAAHSEFFLRALQQRENDIKGKRHIETLKEIEADLDNVRSAWKWAIQMDREDLLINSYQSLHLTFHISGRYHEGAQLFHPVWIQFTPKPGTEPKQIWRLLVPCLVYNATYSGIATPEMRRDLEYCLRMAEAKGDNFQEGTCLLSLGSYEMFTEQEHEQSIPHFERSLSLFRKLNEQFSVALTLIWLSFAHGQNGNPDQFQRLSQESLEISLGIGHKVTAAAAIDNLGFCAITRGDYSAAEDYCRRALEMATEAGRWLTIALANLHLGLLYFLRGDLEAASKRARIGLQIGQRVNVILVISYGESLISLCNSISGDKELGRRLSDKNRLAAVPYYYIIMGHWVRAVSYLSLGTDSISSESLTVGLIEARRAKFQALMTWLLPVAAVLLARDDQPERAVELLALSLHNPQSASGWVEQWSLIKELRTNLRQELGENCYQQAWDRGRDLPLDATVAALLAETTD